MMVVAGLALQAWADAVEWEFPRTGNCHEGMPFSDGVTGVLVWGGDDTINLTVGRADLWDHRGGYPWTSGQNYTNIVRLVEEGSKSALDALFSKETPKGEPRNPYMLPLGRVVIKLSGGATLVRGELDPFTGFGKLFLSDGKIIEIAMSKAVRVFAMRFPGDVERKVSPLPCMTFPKAREALSAVGFKPATVRTDGFDWDLPADPPVSLDFAEVGRVFALGTRRAERVTHPSVVLKQVAFEALVRQSAEQWSEFWAKGAKVKVPDPVIQRIFDYGMYRFGAMTEPDGVPAGLQGPWLEDDKLVPWNGDYHFNINVQECYSPAFRGGHFAHLLPLFRMVLSWRPLLRDNAKKFVGIDDGYVLPHSVDDRGVCIGGFWAGTIDHGSAAWVADLMARYVRYSGDVEFLRDGGLDFMKGAMNVYRAMMEERDGRLSIPVAPSPEWSGGPDVRQRVGRDPSFQLALAHRLCRDLVEMAALLGEKADPMWLEVERRLPLYTGGKGGVWLYEGQPLTASHRHHSHLAGFYPFDVIPFDRKLADETMCAWMGCGTGGWTGWCVPWASALYTHFGESRASVGMLRAWDRYFCDEGHGSHHNAVFCGFTGWSWGRGVMQMDGQCAAATAVMELLVHEVNGKTEFFRGCPPEWKDVSFENIALSDGRRVSGRRLNGKVSLVFDR